MATVNTRTETVTKTVEVEEEVFDITGLTLEELEAVTALLGKVVSGRSSVDTYMLFSRLDDMVRKAGGERRSVSVRDAEFGSLTID